jgi:hypothetical protein
MWEMREAHSLWFFVVIPTGAIRRIAQRRDLLLASSILPPLTTGALKSPRFWQMWEMREAHPLWFFVVIPTGTIRRIAQRRDLLLASSILPPLQPGPLNHLGFGRCGRCAKRIRFGSLLSSRPERSEGSRSGGTCCWDLPSSQPKTVRFWQKWEARASAFPRYTLPPAFPQKLSSFSPHYQSASS